MIGPCKVEKKRTNPWRWRGRTLNVYSQGPDRAEQGFLAARRGGNITQPWFQDGQTGLMQRACRSPTHLTDASANCRAVFNESTLRLEDCNGSNGGPFRALSMVDKSQGGTVRGHGDSFSWRLIKIELPHYLFPLIGQQ